jgi:hypothetical protein
MPGGRLSQVHAILCCQVNSLSFQAAGFVFLSLADTSTKTNFVRAFAPTLFICTQVSDMAPQQPQLFKANLTGLR